MPRYRRKYWGGGGWRNVHASRRRQLSNTFAGIDKDIQNIFFRLDWRSLDTLFVKYGQIYGKSAEKYARDTYLSWRDRRTSLSGQTAERLLNLIPPYLSQDIRYELVKRLRSHYLGEQTKHITTTHERWKADVMPIVEEVVRASSNFSLPDDLIKRATWLANDDVDAANKILESVELEEAKVRTNYLSIEFKRIQSFVDHIPYTQTIRHSIELPQGTINVIIEPERQTLMQTIFGGKKMNENSGDLVPKEELQVALVKEQSMGNLLDLALNDLTPEQKQELTKRALDARLELDISQAKAGQRFRNSTEDMRQTIGAAGQLEDNKSDYEVKSTFETASGKTYIHVRKNNNTVIIVVAVVIGIIVLAMM